MLNSKFFLVQIKLFTQEYPGAQYQKVDEQVFLRSRSNWNSWKHLFGMGWGWGVGLGVVGVLRKGVREEPGCLPFTGANRLVHGLSKGDAKFRTGKCRPGIAYTICTNQLHSPKNDREDMKLVSTMAFNKWNTNFCLEYSVRKKTGLPFQMFRSSRKFSTGTTKKVTFHSLSNRIFCDLFVNGKQARVLVGKTSFEAWKTNQKNNNKIKTNNLTKKQKLRQR